MKATTLGTYFVISLLCAMAYAPAAHAFDEYDDGAGNGCVECHDGFKGGPQNGVLHFNHTSQFGIMDCGLCHPSFPGSKPVLTYSSGSTGPAGGLGCAGCHGRIYDETSPNSGQPKASAYGLRQHHASNGVGICQECHSAGNLGHPDPLPAILDENVAPPYYGTGTNSLGDPCASFQEDLSFDADAVGLDNDGDGDADWPLDLDCAQPTTTTTTTTTLGCGAVPETGCEAPAKGVFLVSEKKAGKEKLKVVIKKLTSAVTQSQFGNPILTGTGYAVCVYDDLDALTGEMLVERPAAQCGTPPKPCWKEIKDKGYKYLDKDASADGILKLIIKGGDAGKGSVVVIGKNNSTKGQNSLPTGIAPQLANNTQATVQLLTSNASCFGVTTDDVKTADGTVFKAGTPP